MDLNIRRLRYFLAVAQHQNFGRAASSLYLSSTALSEQIRKLETELGLRLFDRNPRGAELTEVGWALLPLAGALLESHDEVAHAVERHRRRDRRAIRIGFVTLGAGELGPRILSAFEQRHPVCAVELIHLDYTRQLSAVVSGDVDVAIVRGPVDHSRLRSMVIATEPRMAMVGAGHRLADRRSVDRAALAGERRVDTEGVPDHWRRWWSLDPNPDGSSPPYGPLVHSFDEQLELAAAGVAISIVPATAAALYRRGDVCFVVIDDAPPSEILLCAEADDDSPIVEAFFAAAGAVGSRT